MFAICRGNVSALTDRQGGLITRYRYDAFGGLLTSATAPYNLIGAFGKEYDPASNLIYFGARWYDAPVGRFTTPDPFPGILQDPITLSPYLLAKANPVNYVDRWGLHAEPDYYEVEMTADYADVYCRIWLADRDEWYSYEALRTASQLVMHHVWLHYHKYEIIEFRSERRLAPDGSYYWEIVHDEQYVSDWILVEFTVD